jgi:hypothetical protein
MSNFIFILFHFYLPKESLIISWDAFLMRPTVLLVAFSTMEPIPILSAPFLTPEKNVSHPRPSIARKTMIIIIHVISPMVYLYLIVLSHLTIMYFNVVVLSTPPHISTTLELTAIGVARKNLILILGLAVKIMTKTG